MDSNERADLKAAIDLADTRSLITFMGLAAMLSELQHEGLLPQAAIRRIRAFVSGAIEAADVSEGTKWQLRSMLRSHIADL